MKKLSVIKEKCIGCGACIYDERNDGNFDFDGDGQSVVVNSEVTETNQEIPEICPTGAIEIIEENTENNEVVIAHEN